MPTTGSPSSRSSSSMSTSMPLERASSIILTQSTMRGLASATCNARFRLRSRRVAARTTMTASCASKVRQSLATISSGEPLSSEYAPGRSVSVQSAVFPRTRPRAVSTVLPAQFPVCCRSPVRALNTVLLPTFGLPHRATRSTLIFCLPPQGRGRSARLRFEAPPPCPGFGRLWDRQKRKETGR